MKPKTLILLAALALALAGCAGRSGTIRGTKVADTDQNRQVIDAVERYRLAVERKDTAALLAMASRDYWEDGGTPTGGDDYGYDGLRAMLGARLQQADSIRYSLKYVGIQHRDNRAYVDVLIDASYTIPTSRGPERRDMRDQNRLVLERQGDKWLFLSGM